MIKLKKLYLDGWLSYNKAVIPLDDPGITLIVGAIGSGKSAIPEAIFYLLFGKTLRKKDSVNSLANKVINKGYQIGIDFDIGKVRYTIKEVRGRQDSGLYFYINGKSSRGKNDTQTRKEILDVLAIGPTEFRSIAFLGQRQTQLLVEGTPGQRGQTLTSIFSLDEYDKLIELCTSDLDTENNSRDNMLARLESAEKEYTDLVNTVPKVEKKQIAKLTADIDSYTAKIKKASNKISGIREKHTRIRTAISNLEYIEEQRDQRDSLKSKIHTIQTTLSKLPKTTVTKSQVKNKLSVFQQKQAIAKQKIKECTAALQDVEDTTNTCPITETDCPCNVPVKYREQIAQKATARLNKVTVIRDTLRGKLEKLNKIEDIIDKREKLNAKLASSKESYEAIQEDTERIEELKREAANLDKIEKLLQEENSKIDTLWSTRTDLEKKLAAINERNTLRENFELRLKDNKHLIEKLKGKLAQKEHKTQYLSAAHAVFKKMKLYKIDLVIDLINSYMKEILSRISDEEYCAEFVSQRLAANKQKTLDELNITVYDGYKELPIELCSGGQVTEVGLALLLSVWKASSTISNKSVSCLWLDEVFGPLDEDIIHRVFSTVTTLAHELGATSVHIISHRTLDNRLADRVWVTSRTDGVSSITLD